MARRTITLVEDDIDGGDADETILFALDGVTYEIDLNDGNTATMRDAVGPFLGAARRVPRAAPAAPGMLPPEALGPARVVPPAQRFGGCRPQAGTGLGRVQQSALDKVAGSGAV